MKSDAQLTKLPKWARLHIEKLEVNLRSAARERDAVLSSSGAGARIEVGYGEKAGEPRGYLPATERLRFIPAAAKGRAFDVSMRDGKLYIATERGTLVVEPHASNCIYVREESR